jgi:hypothetical protein
VRHRRGIASGSTPLYESVFFDYFAFMLIINTKEVGEWGNVISNAFGVGVRPNAKENLLLIH